MPWRDQTSGRAAGAGWGVSLRNQRLVGGRVAVLGGALRQGEVSAQEIRGTAAPAQPGGWSGA